MSNLRERRRLQTAQDIQRATLELINEKGVDNVTTLDISHHLGISQRTFFNYYPNKEAALMGPEMHIPTEMIDRFITCDGEYTDCLREFMQAHVLLIEPNRSELLVILKVAETHPRMSQIRLEKMVRMRDELSSILSKKWPLSSALSMNILSDILLSSCWSGIELWLYTDISLKEAFHKSWSSLKVVSTFLAPKNG
ncbi:TetR/AcrR family transcriptional regulator [Marinomonas algarum]|uniref:TetR/AcrR family transcriptional regulator n=1 Tax=Marinomonas algarum TaxID=2883105 RepID=A0A9X1ILS6_9GAMM|nr:TetR/AcrR family transcriptional regulator [Marinomonas algarum]MCB5161252.1 TetR/AcrR family transcriptional regulator [Marinomonas algarum]